MRLYLVNTANTRIFNLALPGARMKLVGGDSGRYERETFVDEVMLAPSERAVLDVMFDDPGEVRLEHRTPDHVYDLGAFSVAGKATAGAAAGSFDALRVDPQLDRRASVDRRRHRAAAGQGARLRGLDAAPLRGRRRAGDLLRLSHASGGHVLGAGNLPEVRDAAASRAFREADSDLLRLSHAPGGHVLGAGNLPEVRDEAGACRRTPGADAEAARGCRSRTGTSDTSRATDSNGKT